MNPITEALDWEGQTVAMDDGTTARIIAAYDEYGEETEDEDDVVSVIIETADGGRLMCVFNDVQVH